MTGGAHRPVPWRYATPATPGRAHYGRAIGILGAATGMPFMPWQQQVARVGTEVDPDTGEWAYHTVIVAVQRQAGKTSLVTPANLHECMRLPDGYCWFTAQTRQAARDSFLRAMKPVMRSKLKPLLKLRRSNGSEGVEIVPNGSEFRVFAPGTDELHGKTNRRVNLDEIWKFDDLEGAELMQAIVPTFTTTAGQLWMVSTAGTAQSQFMWDWVVKGRAAAESGARSGVAYFECSIPPDSDPADLHRPGRPELRDAFIQMVLDNHPANGYTLKPSALYAALAQMPPGEFCRAYGNLWTASAETVINAAAWQAAQIPPALPSYGTRIAYGFHVSPDGADAAIGAAWRDPGGIIVGAVLAAGPGSSWLDGQLYELTMSRPPAGIGYNDFSDAAVAADRIALRYRLPMTGLSGQQYATACGAFKTILEEEDQQVLRLVSNSDLDAAHQAAARRRMGDAWVWDVRQSTGSIAALVAVNIAVWTLAHAPDEFDVL